MKNSLVLLMLLLFSTSMFAQYVSVYVPSQGGKVFQRVAMPDSMSTNDICEKLGYDSSKYYACFFDDNVTFCFKKFSAKMICAVFSDVDKDELSDAEMAKRLQDNNFDYDRAYYVMRRERDLAEGISERSLTVEFMESVTGKKAYDNQIVDSLNENIYTFENGYMVKYTSFDGLMGFAREMKGSPAFEHVKANAKRDNTREADIIDEINMQFYYAARTNYIYMELADSEKYNYNYALLYIDTEMPRISLSDFWRIVHHKADVIKLTPSKAILRYNTSIYTFDAAKQLVSIE